jgi:hypothetical protein
VLADYSKHQAETLTVTQVETRCLIMCEQSVVDMAVGIIMLEQVVDHLVVVVD